MQKDYSSEVKKAANLAVTTAFILIVAKSLAWWKTDSVSILASITDSLLDLLASLMNLFILRYSLASADRDHTFGHGKAESLAALAQSAFISGSAILLLLYGVQRLSAPQPLENAGIGIAVIVFSLIATFALTAYQALVIKHTDSPAIKADRLHYQTDLYMNIAILLSLSLTTIGFLGADAIFAILIALYILVSAVKMLYEAVQLLLDRALPESEIEQIEQIILLDKRVLGFHDLKTRRAGPTRFVQFHLELDDHLSFVEAHEITDNLEQRLHSAFTHIEIVIHHEPTSIVQYEQKKSNS